MLFNLIFYFSFFFYNRFLFAHIVHIIFVIFSLVNFQFAKICNLKLHFLFFLWRSIAFLTLIRNDVLFKFYFFIHFLQFILFFYWNTQLTTLFTLYQSIILFKSPLISHICTVFKKFYFFYFLIFFYNL
jgi:hypothetical protein